MCYIIVFSENDDACSIASSKLPASEIYFKLGIHLKYRLFALLY